MKFNKSIFLILFLLTMAHSGFSQEPGLKIEKLTKDFYIYTTYVAYSGVKTSANALYMLSKDGVILFDTPWDPDQYQPLLDSIRNRHHQEVIAVYATHSHEDRAGGFGFFNKKGIPTYATAATNAILKADHKPEATHLIELDKTIHIGGKQFVIKYFGEGHTADNVVIWFPKEKILDGGCLIKSSEAKNLGYVGEANVKEWPKTISKIQQTFKKINWVIPGHDGWKQQGHLENTLKLLTQ